MQNFAAYRISAAVDAVWSWLYDSIRTIGLYDSVNLVRCNVSHLNNQFPIPKSDLQAKINSVTGHKQENIYKQKMHSEIHLQFTTYKCNCKSV